MSNLSLKIAIESKEKILEHFGKTLEDSHRDVELVTNWTKLQPHFPEVPCANTIEMFLLVNKFNIENTKERLDNYYTIKNTFPQVFDSINPKLSHMITAIEAQYMFPLPKLVHGLYRVIYFRLKDKKPFHSYSQLGTLINIFEVRLQEDFMISDIAIFDLTHLSLYHVLKTNPMVFKIVSAITENVYNNRLKDIHIINYPPVFQKLLALAKLFLKPKLCDRIKLHSNLDSLVQDVPLEILPKEYGGEEKCLDDLEEMWKRKLVEYSNRFDELDTLRVNESLRPKPLKNIEKFGIETIFRKLNFY